MILKVYILKYLRFLLIVTMVVLVNTAMLSSGNSAEASNRINAMEQSMITDNDGRQWYQIEFGLDKANVAFSVSPNEEKPKQLRVYLEDTVIGAARTDYTLDGKLTRYMTLRKSDKKNLEIMVSLAISTEEQDYAVFTLPRDKRLKKPDRLIIRVAKEKLDKGNANLLAAVKGVKGHTVVVDPGHGGADSGARGPHGVLEKDANLAVSLYVQTILEKSGANVVMTRTTDVDVYGPYASDAQELGARVAVGKRAANPDIFVSIHSNAFGNSQANGVGTYYYAKTWLDGLLANNIQTRIAELTDLRNRGTTHANFYVLKHSDIPAALVEMAFITNYKEEALLADDEFRRLMAQSICQGIGNYFATLKENSGIE